MKISIKIALLSLFFITGHLFAAEPAPTPPSSPEAPSISSETPPSSPEYEMQEESKKRPRTEPHISIIITRPEKRVLVSPHKEAVQQSQVTFGNLPAEIREQILQYLVTATGTTMQARLHKAAENIRNFMMTNRAYNINWNDLKITTYFIDELAKRYANRDLIEAALALGTPGAGQWLFHYSQIGKYEYKSITKRFFDAADNGDVSKIRFMLKYIPGINYASNYESEEFHGETPLKEAIFRGNTQVAKALLNAGGTSPTLEMLDEAAEYGRDEIAHLLMDKGVMPDVGTLSAASLGYTGYQSDLFEEMIIKYPELIIDSDQEDRRSILTEAVRCNSQKAVELLLKAGVQINEPEPEGTFKGYTPLTLAVEYAGIPLIALLIKNGADVNQVDNKGKTPLRRAIREANYWNGKLDKMKLLINNGASVADTLRFAQKAKDNKEAIITLLKEHGAT